MGRVIKHVSLERVVSKLHRDLGTEELSKSDIIEWTGEALEFIESPAVYEEKVIFLEVSNHRAEIPNGLHTIRLIARNNNWVKETVDNCGCSPKDILCGLGIEEETSATTFTPGVNVDVNGNLIEAYDLAYYRPFLDVQYNTERWVSSNIYKKEFTPVLLADHSFIGSVVEEGNYTNVYTASNYDEYTITGDTLTFSFKEGFVAIACTKQKVDEKTGYPLIPDEISFTTAITAYITFKYMSRLWYLGREGYEKKVGKAEEDWHWYCKQAYNKATMLNGEDAHHNFGISRQSLLPRRNNIYGFFGKMSKPTGGLGNNSHLINY